MSNNNTELNQKTGIGFWGLILIIVWAFAGWSTAFYKAVQLDTLKNKLEAVVKARDDDVFDAVHDLLKIMRDGCQKDTQSLQEDKMLLPLNDTPLDDDGSHKENSI